MVMFQNIDCSAWASSKRLMVSFSRSIAKRTDSQAVEICLKDEEIHEKEQQIEAFRPQKRRKVIINANNIFASLGDIKQTESYDDLDTEQELARQLENY